MQRRSFLKKSALGTAAVTATGAALVGCGGEAESANGGPAVQTRPRVQWRLASSFPRALDTIFGAADVLADRLEALTDGRFTVRVYPAGELVPGLQVLDAVQNGTVQAGHSASYYFVGKNPAFAFDCAVPFGLTARQQTAWLVDGGGMDLLRPLFADFNVINFRGGNTGVQMGGWFRNEVNSLSDLQNLKMRIPGLGAAVMQRLGATALTLAGGEIYQALERGNIDATEWVGPYDDEKLGFHRVAQYYYYPGWWEPGPALSFYVNRRTWDNLPSEYQQAWELASAEADTWMMAAYDARNPAALGRLLGEGVQLRPFPDDMMRAAREASFDLFEENAADDTYRRIYEPWKAFREAAYRWFGTAEQAYGTFAFGEAGQTA